jgi:hypothetical protein
VRLDGALLQHGSILIAGDQSRLDCVWPDHWTGAGPTSLAEVLGTVPPWKRVAGAVIAGMKEVLDGSWDATGAPLRHPTDTLPSDHASHARDAVENEGLGRDLLGLYRSDSWTWRR